MCIFIHSEPFKSIEENCILIIFLHFFHFSEAPTPTLDGPPPAVEAPAVEAPAAAT